MYPFLDIFFTIFHSALIIFNLFGWIWKRTRKWNILALSITAISWFVVGLWKGMGYCFCTDWHWQVRIALGKTDNPDSYIKFLLDRLTGGNWNEQLVNGLTLAFFLLAFGVSLVLNIRDRRQKRRGASGSKG